MLRKVKNNEIGLLIQTLPFLLQKNIEIMMLFHAMKGMWAPRHMGVIGNAFFAGSRSLYKSCEEVFHFGLEHSNIIIRVFMWLS